MDQIYVAALKEEVIWLDYFNFLGVGKINATLKTIELINRFKPKEIINFGTAGALNNKLNGIIECTKFYQRDMDCRGLLNFKLGETPFDPISKIKFSNEGYICASGDRFVKNQLKINCDIVYMEAYALAKVCITQKIEFKCYKYISDYANDDSSDDWNKNCHKGASLFQSLYPNCI